MRIIRVAGLCFFWSATRSVLPSGQPEGKECSLSLIRICFLTYRRASGRRGCTRYLRSYAFTSKIAQYQDHAPCRTSSWRNSERVRTSNVPRQCQAFREDKHLLADFARAMWRQVLQYISCSSAQWTGDGLIESHKARKSGTLARLVHYLGILQATVPSQSLRGARVRV